MARIGFLTGLLLASFAYAADVQLRRVPDGGLEPQVTVDSRGTVHLIYFTGDDRAGDIFYRASADSGATFSTPTRVNSDPAAALIVGSVRGPRLALDSGNRPHVIWNGSDKAQTKPRLIGGPLLYAKLAGDKFTPQRQIITSGVGLDGGAAIAADHSGNVDIIWHAPATKDGDEQSRKLWLVTSRDDFETRTQLDMPNLGVCACCAVQAFYDDQKIRHVLFRAANQMIHRDMYLDQQRLSKLTIGKCVMSTSAAAGNFIAWEGDNQILVRDLRSEKTIPLGTKNPKHPGIAASKDCVLVAWTENTAWHKGGSVAWQLLDRDLKPLAGLASSGKADDLPTWDYPAAFATPDGSFVILY